MTVDNFLIWTIVSSNIGVEVDYEQFPFNRKLHKTWVRDIQITINDI